MQKIFLPAAILGVTVLATAPLIAQEDSGRRFVVQLEGAAEVVPGDPDGTGTATFRINPGQEQLCYTLRVSGIEPARAAHIHLAPVGVAGPVFVGLTAPTSGSSGACIPITRERAMAIIRDPSAYYVNVHNAPYPGGALRGQLER